MEGKVHQLVHKSPSLVSMQPSPRPWIPCLWDPSFVIRSLCVIYQSVFFSTRLPTSMLHLLLFSPPRTCPALLLRLESIIHIRYGKEFKSWSFSLSNFLHCPVTSYFSQAQMLNVLLQKVALSETNGRCGPSQPDDVTPRQYCLLGHVTRTADRPLSVHQTSSSAEKMAGPTFCGQPS
jgi:hypothetical protein